MIQADPWPNDPPIARAAGSILATNHRPAVADVKRVTNDGSAGLGAISRTVETAIENRASPMSQTSPYGLDQTELVRRFMVLNQMSARLSEARSLEHLWTTVSGSIHEVFRVDRASIALLEPCGEKFSIRALRGTRTVESSAIVRSLDKTLIGDALVRGEVTSYPDLRDVADELQPEAEDLASDGLQAALVAPIHCKGEQFGTINLASFTANSYSEIDLHTLAQAADFLGAAIDNVRAHDAARTAAAEAERLSVIASNTESLVCLTSAAPSDSRQSPTSAVENEPGQAAPDPIDWTVTAELAEMFGDGGDEIVRDVVHTYLGETPALLESLLGGAAADDFEEVGRAAHTIKSSSAYVGATVLSEICARLEAIARDGSLADACDLLGSIESMAGETMAALAERFQL